MGTLHMAAMAFLLARGFVRGNGRVIARGIGDALRDLPAVWQQRCAIQANRRASVAAIARALTWTPVPYLQRKPVVRRVAPQAPGKKISDDEACERIVVPSGNLDPH